MRPYELDAPVGEILYQTRQQAISDTTIVWSHYSFYTELYSSQELQRL
jgi:hypothetical protein